MGLGDTDLNVDADGGGCKAVETAAVACSICLEAVSDNGDRSWAKLQCGHQFHLDCIGSAFNIKGAMQCPNCRKIEKGQWRYANGNLPLPEFNLDDWPHEEDLYDLGYSEMSFGVHWCPFGGLTRLPSSFECALDAEIIKYVSEVYPKGVCSVYCVNGKDVEEPGTNFELVVVISAARLSPQNFCNGSWRSIWNLEFKDDLQLVEVSGKFQVGAHYFEEGNVQLDAQHCCQDSTMFMPPEDCAHSLTAIIRHHETEYLNSLQTSYSNLPDATFKDLRRKLPVTRTLFPWHSTKQFSLNKGIHKSLGLKGSK